MQQYNVYAENVYYGGQQMIDPNQVSVFGNDYTPNGAVDMANGTVDMGGSRTSSPVLSGGEEDGQRQNGVKTKRVYTKNAVRYNEATDTWERRKKTPRLHRTMQITFLSGLAFHNSGRDHCSLREIYAFVSENFQGYDIRTEAWKKSVRHSLCTHKGFYARMEGEANWGFSHKEYFMLKLNEYLDKTGDINLLGLKDPNTWAAIYNGTAGIPPPIAIQRLPNSYKRKAAGAEEGEKKKRVAIDDVELNGAGQPGWDQMNVAPEQILYNAEYMQQYMQHYGQMCGAYPQGFQPVQAEEPDSPTPIDHRDYCAKPQTASPTPVTEADSAQQQYQPVFFGYPYYPMGYDLMAQPQGQIFAQMEGAPYGGEEAQGGQQQMAQPGLEAYYQQMYAQHYYQPEGQLVPQVQDFQQGYYYPASPQENPPAPEAPVQIAVKQEPTYF